VTRLLVLSDQYLSFIKDQVELLAPQFAEVTVIVRHNPVTEVSRVLPLHSLAPYRRDTLTDLRAMPPNVRVFFAPAFFLPYDGDNRRQGDRLLGSVRHVIAREQIGFDLIHAHFVWPNGHVAVRLGEEYGVPVVVTAHGYDIYDLPYRDAAWRDLIGDAVRRADRVIAVSERTRACAREIAPGTEPVVIPNGYRPDLFHPLDRAACREQLGLPQDRPVVLTAGSFVPEKGQRFLINAAFVLTACDEEILWVLLGMGRLHDELVGQIHDLGLEDRFLLPGWADHAGMPAWMNACDLFVLPSVSESFGVVQVEAMACGRPVVGTRNGGSEELLTADEVGLLLPPGDAPALAHAIRTALSREWDPEAIRHHAEPYRWDRIVGQTLGVYQAAAATLSKTLASS
jgi:glycosyltransferase involved in cell wall biosynthesis